MAILAYDHVQLLDVAGPLQTMASCNELLAELGEGPAYEAVVISRHGGPVTTSAGLPIVTLKLTRANDSLHTLIVAGGHGVHEAVKSSFLIEWIRKRARTAQRTASVCTGAFLLAAAGLLDDRKAATHWAYATRLALEYPRVQIDPESIFIEDQDLWTSAGVTAGIDMTLAMIARDTNTATALAVARRLVVYLKRPGGQSQFSTLLLSQNSRRFAELHDWMRANPSADLRVPALAARMAMSERNFARTYTTEVGITPAIAVERLRVEAARAALESDTPLANVATRCGFGSTETMRRSFLRTLGTGPSEYRRRFTDNDSGTR